MYEHKHTQKNDENGMSEDDDDENRFVQGSWALSAAFFLLWRFAFMFSMLSLIVAMNA
jgi:hypothetical protein